MEVAMSGGAVLTNHPEFNPTVIVPPSDRGGPGPRFAATIPALHPTSDSSSGGGILSMEVTLTKRMSLASDIAYEVRRGWAEPMVMQSLNRQPMDWKQVRIGQFILDDWIC